VLRPVLPWLLVALALSVAAIVLGAGRGDKLVPALASGLYGAIVVAAAIWMNVTVWSNTTNQQASRSAITGNIWLAALVYTWGATALLAVYSLSGLTWRHGWQYGLGAAIIAAGLAIYAMRSQQDGQTPPPLYLTALHAAAAGGGLFYLIQSGKLATTRSDWAANNIFLAGGIAVVFICLIAAITQIQFSKHQRA
jgi:hypothetical protein